MDARTLRLQTTRRYAHLDDDPVLDAAERIGTLIADAMGDSASDESWLSASGTRRLNEPSQVIDGTTNEVGIAMT